MSRINEIDKNTEIRYGGGDGELAFHSPFETPFRVHGLLPGLPFRRIPREVSSAVSDWVERLALSTAGGRIRFRTDSKRIVIRAKMPEQMTFPHMTFVGTSCFDIYAKDEGGYLFCGSFISDRDRPGTFESEVRFTDGGEHDVTINLPLYDGVEELFIGLDKDARAAEASRYVNEKPTVYYGSSIVQGGCASRPGNSYEAMISRRFDRDYINLGFAGRALGEDVIADYIAGLPMELFVYDYDYNAPDAAHLEKTHERFFLRIREKRPELPVIIVSRTDRPCFPDGIRINDGRREVIRRTYDNALKRGDNKVTFIDGGTIFDAAKKIGASPYDCTVEGCHPNDLGFACMAYVIGNAEAEVLGLKKE